MASRLLLRGACRQPAWPRWGARPAQRTLLRTRGLARSLATGAQGRGGVPRDLDGPDAVDDLPEGLRLEDRLRMIRLLDKVCDRGEEVAQENEDQPLRSLSQDDLLVHQQFRNNRTVGFDEFLLADKNGDGRVSSAEWEAFLAEKAAVENGLDYKAPEALHVEIPFSAKQLNAIVQKNEGLHISVNGMRYRLTLSPEGKTRDIIMSKEKQLGEVLDELAEMERFKRPLDQKSARHTKRVLTVGLVYLVSQAAVIAKLTFFSRFGWDVMEPVTYFITFGTAILGLVFFQHHKIEYSYPALAALLTQRKASRLYIRNGFDFKRYSNLQALALKLEKQLVMLEPPVQMRNSRGPTSS